MLADKPTKLSRIKQKLIPPSLRSASIQTTRPHCQLAFRTWLWRYTCLLLLMSMLWHRQAIFESKGDKLSSSTECRFEPLIYMSVFLIVMLWHKQAIFESTGVVFLCGIQVSKMGSRQSQGRKPIGSEVKLDECSFIIGTGLWVQDNAWSSIAQSVCEWAFSLMAMGVSQTSQIPVWIISWGNNSYQCINTHPSWLRKLIWHVWTGDCQGKAWAYVCSLEMR